MSYIGQTSRSPRQRYQEPIRYIRHNEPQSAYAQHILNNKHEYSPINNTVTLVKHTNKTSLLLRYKQLHIQTSRQHNQRISEQLTGERNPIYHLIHYTFHTSLRTWPTDQYTISNRSETVPSWSCSQAVSKWANLIIEHRIILYRQKPSHFLEYFNI